MTKGRVTGTARAKGGSMIASWQDIVLPNDGTLGDLQLLKDSHRKREEGVSLMEAVAWLAGEPHSDRPKCACPVTAAFARRVNDKATDKQRQELRELIPALAKSKASRAVEIKRGFLAADYAVRVFSPITLDAAGKGDEAAKLRALPPIVDRDSAIVGRDAAADAAAYAAAAAAYADADAAADAAFYAAAAAYAATWPHRVALLRAMLDIR
jgi:hypothetical protein